MQQDYKPQSTPLSNQSSNSQSPQQIAIKKRRNGNKTPMFLTTRFSLPKDEQGEEINQQAKLSKQSSFNIEPGMSLEECYLSLDTIDTLDDSEQSITPNNTTDSININNINNLNNGNNTTDTNNNQNESNESNEINNQIDDDIIIEDLESSIQLDEDPIPSIQRKPTEQLHQVKKDKSDNQLSIVSEINIDDSNEIIEISDLKESTELTQPKEEQKDEIKENEIKPIENKSKTLEITIEEPKQTHATGKTVFIRAVPQKSKHAQTVSYHKSVILSTTSPMAMT